MPVLVTKPETTLGREVIREVARTGGQVRAFGSTDAPTAELRQLGAVVASGSLLDEGHLETAMEQVHTVIHLGVDPLASSADLVVEEAATVLSAAVGAGIRRLLVLSLPGAAPGADDPLRRAAGEVELLAREGPFPATVVRASLVDSPELRAEAARVPLPSTVLENPVAPVRPDDLAALFMWLDDQRELAGGTLEVLAAEGPTVLPLRDHLRGVGVTPMSTVGRVVERLRPGSPGSVLAETLAGPWLSGGGIADGWLRAGIEPSAPERPAAEG
ncbi:MAG: NAD(P)H-binding protein [Actinobacteria bacterium]|nr:NAD(P)H-binding protein [Actinomycetota bacterium]